MKKKFLVITIVFLTMLIMTACKGSVGYWQIQEITAGNITMTQEEVAEMGLDKAGFLKLQKSGKCVVNILGDEMEGQWTETEDGTISIVYGDNQKGSAVIAEDGIMTFTDSQGTEYKLKK